MYRNRAKRNPLLEPFREAVVPGALRVLRKYYPYRFCTTKHKTFGQRHTPLPGAWEYIFHYLFSLGTQKRWNPVKNLGPISYTPEEKEFLTKPKRHPDDVIAHMKHNDEVSFELVNGVLVPAIRDLHIFTVALFSFGCKQSRMLESSLNPDMFFSLLKWDGVYDKETGKGDLVFPSDCYINNLSSEEKAKVKTAHQLSRWGKPYCDMDASVNRYISRLGKPLENFMGRIKRMNQNILVWDDSVMTGFSFLLVQKLFEAFNIPLTRIFCTALVLEIEKADGRKKAKKETRRIIS